MFILNFHLLSVCWFEWPHGKTAILVGRLKAANYSRKFLFKLSDIRQWWTLVFLSWPSAASLKHIDFMVLDYLGFLLHVTSITFCWFSMESVFAFCCLSLFSSILVSWWFYPCTRSLIKYAVTIRPITDYNEIANHFADCIYVHCYNTRLRVWSKLIKIIMLCIDFDETACSSSYLGFLSLSPL